MLYLWFRSDNSTNNVGFELNWTSIPPGNVNQKIAYETLSIINPLHSHVQFVVAILKRHRMVLFLHPDHPAIIHQIGIVFGMCKHQTVYITLTFSFLIPFDNFDFFSLQTKQGSVFHSIFSPCKLRNIRLANMTI